MAYDVRSIANFVLDVSDEKNIGLSNVAINKIVYFLHCGYLVQYSKALVSAKIEAWPRGPVFRELYHEFKEFEERSITKRAMKIDINIGIKIVVPIELSENDAYFVQNELSNYIELNDRQLVALSHVRGGPWDNVWNHDSPTNSSMQISNEQIHDWYAKTDRH